MKYTPTARLFTVEIDGKPIVSIEAISSREANELLKEEWFREDLCELRSGGEPLWDGKANLRSRPANEAEAELVWGRPSRLRDHQPTSQALCLVCCPAAQSRIPDAVATGCRCPYAVATGCRCWRPSLCQLSRSLLHCPRWMPNLHRKHRRCFRPLHPGQERQGARVLEEQQGKLRMCERPYWFSSKG